MTSRSGDNEVGYFVVTPLIVVCWGAGAVCGSGGEEVLLFRSSGFGDECMSSSIQTISAAFIAVDIAVSGAIAMFFDFLKIHDGGIGSFVVSPSGFGVFCRCIWDERDFVS